jgi:hypothetical protein
VYPGGNESGGQHDTRKCQAGSKRQVAGKWPDAVNLGAARMGALGQSGFRDALALQSSGPRLDNGWHSELEDGSLG